MRAHQASKPRFPFSLGGAPAKAVPHQRECHARNGLYWRPAFAERVKKRPGNAVAPPILILACRLDGLLWVRAQMSPCCVASHGLAGRWRHWNGRRQPLSC